MTVWFGLNLLRCPLRTDGPTVGAELGEPYAYPNGLSIFPVGNDLFARVVGEEDNPHKSNQSFW